MKTKIAVLNLRTVVDSREVLSQESFFLFSMQLP